MATLNTRIIIRNDSTVNWNANSASVLLKGEMGIEFLDSGEVKVKIGDGTKAWSELEYFGGKTYLGDNGSIVVDGTTIKIAGFEGAAVGAQPRKKADGTIEWIKPDTSTVEGLQTTVTGLESDVTALQAQIEDVYTKSEVDSKVAGTYHYKGSVNTYAELPTDAAGGDVYNVATADSAHNIKAGDNVAWTGTEWDVLAGTVDLSGYATTEALAGKVDKVEGSRLITAAEGEKLANIEVGAQVNAIEGVTSELTISSEKILGVSAIAQSKVTGLETALNNKVSVEAGKGLSSNDFTDELLTKVNGVQAGSQANVIESVKVAGADLAITNKAVNIGLATSATSGVVKGSTQENYVAVQADGTMAVNSISVDKITQGEDDYLILNGGTSSI